MSFDLCVWHSTRAIDAATAGGVYAALAEEREPPEAGGVVASPAVAAFVRALGSHYPDLDTLDDADVDDSPWSGGFETSDRHVLLAIRWSARSEVTGTVVRLAAEHGLVLYDPQVEEVHLPPGLTPPRT